MNSRISLSLAVILLIAGCKSPKTPGDLPPPEGDLAYLLDADPSSVTSAQLLASVMDADERMDRNHVVEGIYWQAVRSSNSVPEADLYGKGGDTMLFSGFYTAARAYRYGVSRDSADLDKAIEALRGLYILTHISGDPGVLMRCAFPTGREAEFQYPETWGSRIEEGFVYTSPDDIDDPFNPGAKLPQMTFYTRVTRDQISGLIYGLSVFWQVMDPSLTSDPAEKAKIEQARRVLADIVSAVYYQLKEHDFHIRDQTGRNDTRADDVGDDLLGLSLYSLYRHTAGLSEGASRTDRVQKKYDDIYWILETFGAFPSDPFNGFSNTQQYYAWNLRFTRSAAVWLNGSSSERELLGPYVNKWMFKWVKNHKNAWFSFVYALMTDPLDESVRDGALLSLKSWSLRPVPGWSSPLARGWGRDYDEPNAAERLTGAADDRVLWPHLRKPTTYWTWQKDPWDVDVTYPMAGFDGVAIDLSLPYWMARYHGLIQ